MRFLALALALAGCYTAPASTSTPANKVTPPDRAHAADDVLAFLPIDSALVMHLDVARLRGSPLWERQLAPVVTAMAGSQLEMFQKLCGFDLPTAIQRVSIGVRSSDGTHVEGVVVGHSGQARRGFDCVAREGAKAGTVTADGEVLLVKNKRDMIAMTAVSGSAVVAQLGTAANRGSLDAVLASGSPLRSSPTFLGMFDKLEPGASLWFVINAGSPMFSSLSASGFQLRHIDGSLTVKESYVLAARVRAASADEAARLVAVVDTVAPQVRQMVETFSVRADGDVVRFDLVVTEPQAQTIMTMLGGILGP